jgi:transcriptional regulator with XRE-family HTH domain
MFYPTLKPASQPQGLSQSEVAKLIGVTPGRVGQIEREAIKKLRKLLLADSRDVDLTLSERNA